MSEKNSSSKSQLSSSIKTMSIVGILLLFAVVLNYINGSKLQNLPTPAPSSRNRDSPSLSVMLYDRYLARDEIATDSLQDVKFHPSTNSINGVQMLGDESLTNSRVSNMLQVLEYEKLKSFLRKFSMKTLHRLRKLITANPDAGHRYLVKLVQKQRSPDAGAINPYAGDEGFSFSDSSSFPLDRKQLIKIATVILEPEFLELAEKAEEDESDSTELEAESGENANRKPHFSEDRDKILTSSIQAFPVPSATKAPGLVPTTKSTKFFVPYFSQASVVHKNFMDANSNPKFASEEAKGDDFRPSYGVPVRIRKLIPPMPFPTPTSRTYPPSLKHDNFIHAQAPHMTRLQPKPVVELLQVVKSPSEVQLVWKNQTSSGEFIIEAQHQNQNQSERDLVSFYILSILAAQDKLTEHVFHQQQPEQKFQDQDQEVMYYNGGVHEVYRNQWTNSDADYKHEEPPQFNLYEHQEKDQDYEDSYHESAYTNTRHPHQSSPNSVSGFQFGAEKWNRYGLPATGTDVSVQSPYDSSYQAHAYGNGNYYQPQSQAQPGGSPYESAGIGSKAPYGEYGGYGPAHHYYNVDSVHPFGGYGNGQLNMHVNHVENSPNVIQTQMWDLFSNWINSTKQALSSMLQGFQNSSTATQKVLGISLSALAFLAFGSYISILLLRALAPALFLQNPTSQSGATNLAGLLYGRSLDANAKTPVPPTNAVLSELERTVKLSLEKFL